MRAIAEPLGDQDIADMAAYYEGHGKVEGAALPAKAADPSGKVAALLNKGGCIACHGGNFNTPIDPTYPRLPASMPITCLWRSNPTRQKVKRPGAAATPSWPAWPSSFSNAELKELAAYLHAQASELKTVPQKHFR